MEQELTCWSPNLEDYDRLQKLISVNLTDLSKFISDENQKYRDKKNLWAILNDYFSKKNIINDDISALIIKINKNEALDNEMIAGTIYTIVKDILIIQTPHIEHAETFITMIKNKIKSEVLMIPENERLRQIREIKSKIQLLIETMNYSELQKLHEHVQSLVSK